MAIYQLNNRVPVIHPTVWVADSAHIIGQVFLEQDSSVWFGVVIRADTEVIKVGRGSNIQDNSVLHADAGKPLTVGDNVTVGRQAMLHGCSIGEGSLVGIKAVVLNSAKIGKNCLVGAGALITEGKEFPDGSLILGSPAKVIMTLSSEQIEGLKIIAQQYVNNAKRYQTELKKLI